MRQSHVREVSAGAQASVDFRLEVDRPVSDTVVVVVFGDVDLHSAGALDERLADAIAGGATSLVVDLTPSTFVDSQGLGVLLRHARRLDPREGRFRLVVARAEIRRVFELASLDRIFPLDATRDDALARLSRDPSADA